MDRIEQIESYLAGTMEPQSRSEFESLLKSDGNLKNEVESYKDLVKGIELAGETEFENKVKSWEEKLRKQQDASGNYSEAKVRSLLRRTYLSSAAIVVLLASLVYLLWPSNQSSLSTEQHFADNFQPYEDLATVKSGQENKINEAMALYGDRKYDEAIVVYDQVLDKDSLNALILLYKGVSLLASDPPAVTKAQESLQKSLNQNSDYRDAAEWYLALAALKAKNKEKAIQLLQKIETQTAHDYKKAAQSLLMKLK